MFVLARGVLEVRRREAAGEDRVLGRIGPGEYIGEIGMMTGDPRPVSVRANTPVMALDLARAVFDALLTGHPELGPRMQPPWSAAAPPRTRCGGAGSQP